MIDNKNIPLALVTGAAHRLGRAFAISLAGLGFAIGLHFHNSSEEAQATAEEIRNLGVPVKIFQGDLTDISQIEALFIDVDTMGFPLRVLVNSAAVMGYGNLKTCSITEFDSVMDLNLRAPFICAQSAAIRMQQGGLIVNVSDVGAQKTWTGYPVYVVSKAGLESLTRVLARTLAPSVRVNAIAPGLVYPSSDLTSDDWQKLVDRIPLKRSAKPEEITGALEFLLKNEYITGQTIIVDGGYSLI
jgi:pteridine reductase